MLDIGFKPAIDRIVAKMPRERQTLFFSATLEGATGKLAAAYTATRGATSTSRRGSRVSTSTRFVHLSDEAKVDALVQESAHRAWPHPRCPHQAGRRPARQEARQPEGQGGGHAGEQVPEPAPPRPRRLRAGKPARWSDRRRLPWIDVEEITT